MSALAGNSNGVTQMVGTSCAAPLLAGVGLLIRQYYSDTRFYITQCQKGRATTSTHGCSKFKPSGALIKAMIIASATKVNSNCDKEIYEMYQNPNSLYDFSSGYGLPNIKKLLPMNNSLDLELHVREIWISHGSPPPPFTLTVKPNTSIVASLCYYDPPGPDLIVDVDVEIRSRCEDKLYTAADHVNPCEKIYIPLILCSNNTRCPVDINIRIKHMPKRADIKAAVAVIVYGKKPSFYSPTPPIYLRDDEEASVNLPFKASLLSKVKRVGMKQKIEVQVEQVEVGKLSPPSTRHYLESLSMTIDSGHMSNFDIAVMALIIRHNSDMVMQIGGAHGYLTKSIQFRKFWPVEWEHRNRTMMTRIDVSQFQLTIPDNADTSYDIILSSGWPYSYRAPVNITGNIQLAWYKAPVVLFESKYVETRGSLLVIVSFFLVLLGSTIALNHAYTKYKYRYIKYEWISSDS